VGARNERRRLRRSAQPFRRFVAWGLLAGLGFSMLASCGKNDAPPAMPAMPPPQVTVGTVESRDVPIYIDEIGKCASPEIVSVQTQATGKIVGVHFTEGADLKPGADLYTIDPAPFQAAVDQITADMELNTAMLKQSRAMLEQYKAELGQAQAALAEQKTRQGLYLSERDRAKSLLAENAGSKQDFEAKDMAVNAGDSQIKSAEATIERAKAQINQANAAVEMGLARVKSSEAAKKVAEINLGYTHIKSPIEGRAGQRLVDLGNVVVANQNNTSTTLVTIQRMDPLYVDFTVPEKELGRVRASMEAKTLKVEARLPESPEARYGDVVFIDNSVQEGTGTLKLRAKMDNADRYLWPGQFVKVRLLLGTIKNATLVPSTATQIGQDGTFVFVVTADETAKMRPVKVGQKFGDQVVITDGLKAGETVVLSGQLKLIPDGKVAVAKDKP